MIWVFMNHVSELIWGGPSLGNPHEGWPPLSERLGEWQPLGGYGAWNLPVNAFRYVGWLGDQAVALFLIASGFGLALSLLQHPRSEPAQWRRFYFRRLWRIYPLWWTVHLIPLFRWVTGRLPPGQSLPLILSLAGFRADATTYYFYSPSWWFIGLLIQLYIAFPLLWTLMDKLGPIRFLAAAIVSSAIARGAGMIFFGPYVDPWLRGSVFITRLPEFALGMALAHMMQADPVAWDARLRSRASILMAAGLYFAGTAISLTWLGMTVAPFVVCLGSFGLLYPLLAPRPSGSRAGFLGWVGVHSYAIYLVHEIVLQRFMTPSVLTSRVIFLIIVCAGLSAIIGVGLEWALDCAAKALTRAAGTRRGSADRRLA
jgi:peptidoglycan/LPS O-acetylase OafA/YrhL